MSSFKNYSTPSLSLIHKFIFIRNVLLYVVNHRYSSSIANSNFTTKVLPHEFLLLEVWFRHLMIIPNNNVVHLILFRHPDKFVAFVKHHFAFVHSIITASFFESVHFKWEFKPLSDCKHYTFWNSGRQAYSIHQHLQHLSTVSVRIACRHSVKTIFWDFNQTLHRRPTQKTRLRTFDKKLLDTRIPLSFVKIIIMRTLEL